MQQYALMQQQAQLAGSGAAQAGFFPGQAQPAAFAHLAPAQQQQLLQFQHAQQQAQQAWRGTNALPMQRTASESLSLNPPDGGGAGPGRSSAVPQQGDNRKRFSFF